MSNKIFIKFGDIQGDVQDAKHKNWIEINSYHFSFERSASQETGSQRRSVGAVQFSTVTITKKMALSTQQIFSEGVSGTGKNCVIHLVNGGEALNVYMEYKLENAIISKYSVDCIGGSGEPIEQIEISYTRLESVYTPCDAKGIKGSPRSAGYDISQAKTL